jgi:hypothetical protein
VALSLSESSLPSHPTPALIPAALIQGNQRVRGVTRTAAAPLRCGTKPPGGPGLAPFLAFIASAYYFVEPTTDKPASTARRDCLGGTATHNGCGQEQAHLVSWIGAFLRLRAPRDACGGSLEAGVGGQREAAWPSVMKLLDSNK